ncbi:Leukotoxin translocation ATP-binding protein LktB [Planktothrix tepida]|uniref:Peptidase, C39 family n=1 Tax=Planktothrix tepida PCC 9214 TaxID=671072 RepID=A0A1J1LQZ8_9CYAN|nr:peptidase domain-containing ABC transporter [Planktothrix tepida]CAD5965279.1 Leukotoxin translocation ATP-binding protein LktB [Planktothrix tepida]CUR35000.1 Peptidase, C39 family [Planktothrix tepida PCC 9214]
MKTTCVLQHSQEDCGAACLASITKYYGRNLTLNRIREAVGTGQLGTTLLGLKRGSEALGFNARGGRASEELLEQLNQIPLPAIIHWRGSHWVVLYGKKGGKYILADPALGIRYLSRQDLLESWGNGLMLLLEPDSARFFAQPDETVNHFGRFLKPVWTYRTILGEAFLINLVLGVLSLAYPFFIQLLTDEVLVRGDLQLLNTLVIAIAIMNLISSILRLIQSNLIAHFAQRLQLGLVLDFCRVILRLPLPYYESHRSGEVISRLRDIQEINQLVSQIAVNLPSQFVIAAVSLGFMLFYSTKLTLSAGIFALIMTLSVLVFLPYLQQKTRSVLVLEAENQGVLVETFKGALTLKATTAAPQFWEEFQSRFGRLAHQMFRLMQISIINTAFSGLILSLGSVILLWLGSRLVISKELTIGQLLAFNSMNGNFLTFIATGIGFVDEFYRAKTATQRLTEVIDSTPENLLDFKKQFVKIPPDAEILCRDLNFYHVGRINLLENFSVKIPGGQVIALIGKSGCGKSTLAKLISGLYQPQSGNIQIDFYNLQDLSLDSLRQQIVLVPQEAHFWSRSILDNFRLAAPQATFEQIVRACQITGASEFINQIPDKYQTILGEFGANISGGQRQRLALARAIVNDPPILILDESTGSLDPVSEVEILDKLLAVRQGKTTIIISHRPRIIERADWIILIENGKLKMQGYLKDLRSKSGEHLGFLTP